VPEERLRLGVDVRPVEGLLLPAPPPPLPAVLARMLPWRLACDDDDAVRPPAAAEDAVAPPCG